MKEEEEMKESKEVRKGTRMWRRSREAGIEARAEG